MRLVASIGYKIETFFCLKMGDDVVDHEMDLSKKRYSTFIFMTQITTRT